MGHTEGETVGTGRTSPRAGLAVGYPRKVVNTAMAAVGLMVQASAFLIAYLLLSPTRGRSAALLYAAVVSVFGYALVLSASAALGVPWQFSNGLLFVVVAASLAARTLRERITRAPSALVAWMRTAAPAAAIVLVLLGVQAIAVILMPELSIDGQLYHGPILAELLEHGTLWGWTAPNQYMFYTDLTMMGGVNLAAFTGQAIFDNGIQMPHLLILLLAVNVLLRRRFAQAWVRVAFAALIVSAPVIWLQPRILYVDVAYAAAVASAMVLIVSVKRVRFAELIVVGACAAAVLATKPAGILTSGLLVVVWVAVASIRRVREGTPWWRAVRSALLGAAVPMLCALAFYARNLVAFGNPVYPVKFRIGPVQLNGVIDFAVFASGDRGAGLVDPGRIPLYAGSLIEGIVHGVIKADYDPRGGGFGHMPLAVLGLAAILLVLQVLFVLVLRRDQISWSSWPWRTQVGILALVLAVLVIQPSSFDTRYVIGPTVVLMAGVLLSTPVAVRTVDVVGGALALLLAMAQVAWTEMNAYPGLTIAKQLRTLASSSQPPTPGNPWGRGEAVAWLPADRCVTIALETHGGVKEWGNAEQTALSAMPYALYGEHLCNRVVPVEGGVVDAGRSTIDPIPTADYFVIYEGTQALWRTRYPGLAECWREVAKVPGGGMFAVGSDVLANNCR